MLRKYIILGLFYPLSILTPAAAGTSEGSNLFAIKLYQELKSDPLFFSPYSIRTALAMTYAGARNTTESEMAKVLDFALPQADFHGRLKEFCDRIMQDAKRSGIDLSIANSLWGQKGEAYLDSFLKLNRNFYEAGFNEVDFRKNESACQIINTWVSEHTRNRIQKLLLPPDLIRATLVLTNAIYFKAPWKTRFKESETRNGSFHLSKNLSRTVPFMHQTLSSLYREDEDFQLLEMPYQGELFSLVILLPRKVSDFSAINRKLSAEQLDLWLAQSGKAKVRLSLPRFKMTSRFQLADTLKHLGMSQPFSPQADFSGINGKHDLFISAVIHKAFIEVNEQGSEAAAATAVVMTRMESHEDRVVTFNADHPFLFLIRHIPSGTILFMGKLSDPQKSQQ